MPERGASPSLARGLRILYVYEYSRFIELDSGEIVLSGQLMTYETCIRLQIVCMVVVVEVVDDAEEL